MKKILFLPLLLLVLYSCEPMQKKIKIPDEKFKSYLVANYDNDGDGEISKAEATLVEKIEISTDNVYSLEGLEHFVNLEHLDCDGSQVGNSFRRKLTSINISNLTFLKHFSCRGNKISTLNVENNRMLETLYCDGNQLTGINIQYNTLLKVFSCWKNQISIIDVSQNRALVTIFCRDNNIMNLDITNNVELRFLECSENKLQTINTSKNGSLEVFACSVNNLTTLDVSENRSLNTLACNFNDSLYEIWFHYGQSIATIYKDEHTVIKYK